MNIFCELRTYTDRKNKTQIENFTTESLKYIFNYSLINRTLLVGKIMSYFEIPFNDYSDKLVVIAEYNLKNLTSLKPDNFRLLSFLNFRTCRNYT